MELTLHILSVLNIPCLLYLWKNIVFWTLLCFVTSFTLLRKGLSVKGQHKTGIARFQLCMMFQSYFLPIPFELQIPYLSLLLNAMPKSIPICCFIAPKLLATSKKCHGNCTSRWRISRSTQINGYIWTKHVQIDPWTSFDPAMLIYFVYI